MGTAFSLGIFALGAVLAFAVRSEPAGLDITAVGVILMLVGAIHFGWTAYREQWRRRVVEESIDSGHGAPPMPVDDTVLVDPSAPIVAPTRPVVVADDDVRHDGRGAPPVVNVNVEPVERAG